MKREFNITGAQGGSAFTVRVVTRASRTEFAGVQDDGLLKVRLTGSPTDGEANEQLVEFLSEFLGVDVGAIEIVAGETSRDKLITVDGLTPDVLESKITSVDEE